MNEIEQLVFVDNVKQFANMRLKLHQEGKIMKIHKDRKAWETVDEFGAKIVLTMWESHARNTKWREGVTILIHDAEVKLPFAETGRRTLNAWANSSMILEADADEAL